MRVLVATDAWHPQVNGVVRTLTALARSARSLGVEIEFLSPDGFGSIPCPTYPACGWRFPAPAKSLGESRRSSPAAIHIATEGPIGLMVRAFCVKRGLNFTTSYTTRFPEYISSRIAIPESWSYAALRRFHAPAPSRWFQPVARRRIAQRGFQNLGMWTRGVNTDVFQPTPAVDLPFRPIFMSVGRIASRKESRGVPVAGSAGLQGRDRRRASRKASSRAVFRCAFHWPAQRKSAGLASRGRGRLCVSEPHRHLRHRAARSAGLWNAGRSVSGDRAEGRDQESGRRAERRFAHRVPEGPFAVRARPAATMLWATAGRTARGNSSLISSRLHAGRLPNPRAWPKAATR